MFSVHATPEEFENGGFTLKSYQMFFNHTTPEEFENRGFTLETHQMCSNHTTPEEFENGGFTMKTHQMFSVHTTPEEFENRGFTLKTHQMFTVNTTPEKFKNRRRFHPETHQIFTVHPTPFKFKNGGFTVKRIKCFPFTLRWRNLKTQQSPVLLDLCLMKTREGKSCDYSDVIVLEQSRSQGLSGNEVGFGKALFSKYLRPHENEKPAFSKNIFSVTDLCVR